MNGGVVRKYAERKAWAVASKRAFGYSIVRIDGHELFNYSKAVPCG